MEENDSLMESNVNTSISNVQQPIIDGNSCQSVDLNDSSSRNETAVVVSTAANESDGNDKSYAKEEREISSVNVTNSTDVNKVNGLATIANCYSDSDGETCTENSAGSVDYKDAIIENEQCIKEEDNNSANACVNAISVSEKDTSLEKQKNDLNSVNLLDSASQIIKLESEGCSMKSSENGGCTVTESVNIGHTFIEPVSVGCTVKKLENDGHSRNEPVNAGCIVTEPGTVGHTVIKLENDGHALNEPVNAGCTVTEPASVGHALIKVENNVGHSLNESVNAGHLLIEPENVENMPPDTDTVHQVYAMGSIDKELENICENEGAAQRGKVTEVDSSGDSSSDSDDESSSESSSTDSSSDDDLEDIRKEIEKEEDQVPTGPLKTKGELLIKDLPEVPDLDISIDDSVQLVELGVVFSIVESLVVVKALPQTPTLDSDSILFLENKSSLGLVFETFGPVQTPFYSVRFNKDSDISDKNIQVGDKVFYAPDILEYSNFVFVTQLKQLKGSDASWEHDEEPPQEAIEYSDDEEEAKVKASRKKGRMTRDGSSTDQDNTQKMEGSGTMLHQEANRGSRKRTWRNRAKGQQPVNQNQNQNQVISHTNQSPVPHPAYRGPAPWHGNTLPPRPPAAGRPYMGQPAPEPLRFGMGPIGPPRGVPPRGLLSSGPPPRGRGMMPAGPMGQFPVTHHGPMTNAPMPSFGPSRPLTGGAGFQGPWPVGPSSGFAPRYPIPAPQGFPDSGGNVGFQGRDFMGMPPPPPPPPPNM